MGRLLYFILNTGTDCGFSLPLPAGEGWGEGIQKSTNRYRSQYSLSNTRERPAGIPAGVFAEQAGFGFQREAAEGAF